ncbi:hypothetical protein JEZ13_00960 [bacterium]|nr:hypothetical protein [bacterium]
MKKVLLLLVAVMLTLTINATPGSNQDFDGSLTIINQYLDGYHNTHLKWEDLSSSNEHYAYIITVGNSDNEENHIVKGYTTDNNYSIYKNPNLPNISPRYNVYKMNFTENVELADFFPNDNGHQFRASMTWSQIKELLKKKSNNIWRIRRNNIPTNLK